MDKKFDVCLVMPPIANIRYSSLALSLLKSCLINEGISCTIDYASMRFARLFGLYNCSQFQAKRTIYFHHMPEVIFSEFAGIKPRKDVNELIKVILEEPKTVPEHLKSPEALKNFLDELRIAAGKTVDETVEKILSFDAKIVGLTSSFRQECASLAIMKKVKEMNPSVTTMIGGANCMGTAGIAVLKKFKFVDYVFLGEADDVFADICRHILDGEKDFKMPYGLLRQGGEIPEKVPHRIITNMSKVPSPEADDFFAALKENFTDDEIKKISPVIMTEGSRGCWWGEKHSCTFCGLNGLVKTYRQKTPQRIADELNAITDRYGNYEVWFSDCILSRPAREGTAKTFERTKRKTAFVHRNKIKS